MKYSEKSKILEVVYEDDGTYLIKTVKEQFKKSLTELEIEEARKAVRRYGDIANKRIRAIQGANLYSPALRALQDKQNTDTPHFSTVKDIDYDDGPKAINQLRHRLSEIQAFLDSDTSTITGARRYRRDVENRLGLENVSDRVLSTIWAVIARVKEVNPIIANYTELGQYIFEAIQDDLPNLDVLEDMPDSEIERMIDNLAAGATDIALQQYYDSIKSGVKSFF